MNKYIKIGVNTWLVLMSIVFLQLVGCDEKQQAKLQYPPPYYLGNGGVLVFPAKNVFGNFIFHESLTQYLQQNANLRVVSIMGLEEDGEHRPTKYLVVCEFIDHKPPPNPTTAPSVNDKGEIQYP